MVGENDGGKRLEIGTSTELSLVPWLNKKIKLGQCPLLLMDKFM